MTEQAIAVAGAVTAVSFLVAAGLALAYIPRKWGGSNAPMLILAAAMGLEAFIGLSNFLQYSGITSSLDLLEDYAEILFAPLIVFTLVATETQLRLREQARAARVLQQEHDMLLNIVDTTPAGILIVAPGGHITFANDAAREMLGITEDADTGQLLPGMQAIVDEAGRESSLDELLAAEGAGPINRTLVFADGVRTDLRFTVTTMSDRTNALGGAVVGVERAL